ncbi:microviridin/marinostatin family tricyclic proteinase inhibitor [Nostoc sp. FACHB-110]|uniref:microviridin/marinostatin family tricyclic proteinase inhibitor n=1 Tax=Nostoc sp. FACHB-110 TaxID=2692834 RepID=UPI001682CBC6|nr:microviridin/marinostatin family tricyclic proteinase inhibitor [Nostoc sp. FACHB-110]MBD2438923.1 microviridin/marinostatin family tricyclic proteinase inhibitor [Nostoc sp. FACHB-110]
MSTKTFKTGDIVVPFFARFLEAQAEGEGEDTPTPPSFPWTFKYPSDFEDA